MLCDWLMQPNPLGGPAAQGCRRYGRGADCLRQSGGCRRHPSQRYRAGAGAGLPLHKHFFQTGFLDVFQLIQLALLKGDEGVEVFEIGKNFILFIF